MNPNENDQELLREEVDAKPVYEAPHIHRIEKVELLTHGTKDEEDDTDSGGYKKSKA
jgi:hypothetical protein